LLFRNAVQIVIGANGLIGSFLSYKLAQTDANVLCVLRNDRGLSELSTQLKAFDKQYQTNTALPKIVFGDILDYPFLEDLLKEGDVVYHCAAIVSFNPRDREKIFKTNIEGTANLVNAGLFKHIEKFCYISSVAAIGRNGSGKMIDEDTFWENNDQNSNYAISKYEAELEVWRGAEEGLKIVIVNPSIVLGYSSKGKSSSSIFHQIKKGFAFKSLGVNGFVGVSDVVKAIIQLNQADIVNERFILNSENLQYAQVFDLIAKAMGKKTPPYIVKSWMKWIVLPLAKIKSVLNGKAPFITGEVFNTAMEQNNYSAQKIKDAIGFEFTPIAKIASDTAKMMS